MRPKFALLYSDAAPKQRNVATGQSDCSAVRVKPPEDRNCHACKHADDPQADRYPVLDRRGISLKGPAPRCWEQIVQDRVYANAESDSSLDKAGPKRAAASEAEIGRDDASEDFIKEELHSKIRHQVPILTLEPSGLPAAGYGPAVDLHELLLAWCGRI